MSAEDRRVRWRRVVVPDDAWRELKTAAETQGKAVSVYLGELVEQEAARLRRAHAKGEGGTVRQNGAVALPSGGLIGLGVASALVSTLAAPRLDERQRWRPSDADTPRRVEAMAGGPTMSCVRRAVAAINARRPSAQDDDVDGAGPDELSAAVEAVEGMFGRIPIAAKCGGGDVVVDLDQLSGLCLVGEGAEAMARAVIVATLAHYPYWDVELRVVSHLGLALCPRLEETAGVEVIDDVAELIDRLEVQLRRRRRFLADHEVFDFKEAFAGEDPLEAFLVVVPGALIQSAPQVALLESMVSVGRRYGISLLFVGAPAVEGLERLPVDGLGRVSPHQMPPLLLEALEFYRLAPDEASELIAMINAGRDVPVVAEPRGEGDGLRPGTDAEVIYLPTQPGRG